MNHSVICYPQPGKAKSFQVCSAFASGCGGIVRENSYALERGVPACFYGTARIETVFRSALESGVSWYYLDNSYFDVVRGVEFRASMNRLQRATTKPDWDRYKRLGVQMKPWRKSGKDIVVIMQSDYYMKEIARWPGGALGWQGFVLRKLRAATNRPIVVRHWSRDKQLRSKTLAMDLKTAWAVVTHSSAAGIEALLEGIPVFVTDFLSAAAEMSAGGLSGIEAPFYPDGREEFGARLAASQWTLTEMRDGLTWRSLHAE